MINPITQQDMAWLFDTLWPWMKRAASHHANCLAQFNVIEGLFRAYRNDPDALLLQLDNLKGIGLVIASGLIFSSNRDSFIPFDRYTMGWALRLGIIPDHYISQGTYAKYSQMIVAYINRVKHLDSIFSFVREAEITAKGFPVSPA